MKFTRGGWNSRCNITHTTATENGLLHYKTWRVAADAEADISTETVALIAGSNEDLVFKVQSSTLDCMRC